MTDIPDGLNIAQRVAREAREKRLARDAGIDRPELAGAAEGYEYLANGQYANGQPDDNNPYPVEPAPEDGPLDDEPSSWEPVDLGPYLRGEVVIPEPSLGIVRSDGLRLLYPGREHAVVGETESGKTWLALGCVAAELTAGNTVVYSHYEEGDPVITLERLQLLGVDRETCSRLLRFVAPCEPPRREWIKALLVPVPTLVVHDGVNEALTMLGASVDMDGASLFRRVLVRPFLRAGAATLACDHVPMTRDGSRRDAIGTVHKGNTIDGARIMLENSAPFGREMRGASRVYVTKDRPGYLRSSGRPGKTPGKTFMGMLVVDDADTFQPLSMMFYAPKDDDGDSAGERDPGDELADTVWQLIAARPDRTVESIRQLRAALRAVKSGARNTAVRDAVDDLVESGRLTEVPKGTAIGYRAESTGSQESSIDSLG